MLRLLHVDDNPEDLEITKIHLQRFGEEIQLEWAQSGEEALAALKSEKYSCILSDYQMPTMDGLELLKTLRQQGNETPFIFLTGQGNEEVAAEALREGADDYYTKEVGFAHYTRLLNALSGLLTPMRDE